MLRFASFPAYVMYSYQKLLDTIYIFTQKTVQKFFRHILLIYEWNLQMVEFKTEDTDSKNVLWKRWCARLNIYAPLKKEGHTALHMSVGLSVCLSVSRYVGLP